MIAPLWQSLQTWLPRRLRQPTPVPDQLWQRVVCEHPFLRALDSTEQEQLRRLAAHFLFEKEFHGAHQLAVTDAMALSIAAQACLPLLHIALPTGSDHAAGLDALDWYNDFVGIVVQPGAAVAQRKSTDATGVVHQYQEVLAGEAMRGGPVMLSWHDVALASQAVERGSNVVIHEFAHKIDMHRRDGSSIFDGIDGAPELPAGFMGLRHPKEAREHWRATMSHAYAEFREAVALAERFDGATPWLDAYGSTNPAEFFAVTSEAYFVNRNRFELEFPTLLRLYDGFYRACAAPAVQRLSIAFNTD